jgi:hypothetical protein
VIVAWFYVLVAGVVWFAEGFLFSRFFSFSVWQTALAAVFYLAVFIAAVMTLARRARGEYNVADVARWRLLSLAPMLVVILGSFVSLPVMLLVLALGKAV